MTQPVNGSARSYSSTVREEGARLTRRSITAAATELFIRDGYAATSLAAIAREAHCARPTVFAVFGSKSALLRQVLDEALAGDDEPVPVAERPWFQPVWSAQSLDELASAYADVCAAIGRRAAGVFEVVRRAVDADPEIRAVWEDVLTNRRSGAQMIVTRALDMPGAIAKREQSRAVDLVWFANDPAHYATLIDACGWSEAHFHAWLTWQIRSALGAPTPSGDVEPAPHRRRGAH